MRTPASALTLLLGVLASPPLCAQKTAEEFELRNETYRVVVQPDGSLLLATQGTEPLRFTPSFTVLRSEEDPQIALRPGGIPNVKYNVPTWIPGAASVDELKPGTAGRSDNEVGDGFDARILEADDKSRTSNFFRAARSTTLTAGSGQTVDGRVQWTFPEHSDFSLRASLDLTPGESMPSLRLEFRARRAGWYSIGYTGAPAAAAGELDEVWQPLIWNEKRFPDQPYLTLAFRAPLPTTLVTRAGTTVGVVADPAELPYQPLPTFENSRFGVMVRNAEGRAQPMLFAPVLGGIDSYMEAGEPYEFRMRLLVHRGDAPTAFRHAARQLYGFRDYRRNAGHTLNATIENMIDYAFSSFAHWNADLKGSDYITDVPGSVKNVSSLHPLSVALITDSERIYRERAYPMIEYLLSREKFLFTVDPQVTGQSASWRMKGPAAALSEYSTLYEISGRRSPVLLHLADSLSRVERVLNLDTKVRGDSWPNLLALYRATGEPDYLDRARAGADSYLRDRVDPGETDFVDPFVGGEPFFWTEFVPHWMALLELYEETGEQRYLDGALRAARGYAMFVWMSPRVPDEPVLVNEGGKAPHYWYLRRKGHERMEAPEAFVAAWKLSEIGLTPESSGTSNGHRGIFLTSPAPWLLRLARAGKDDFLRDIARSAVVGRYANFPGYHLNTARTDVFMDPDYPLRPHEALGYNSIHYNHIWPHIALLYDYLVAEAYYRSHGRIDFPSHYAEGYGYLQSRIYGDRPGQFYDTKSAWLWMPRGVASVDDDQVNYLAVRSADALHFALMNQSEEPVRVTLRLNQEVVILERGRVYPVATWADDGPAGAEQLNEGTVTVTVAPKGLTALSIAGLTITPRFQQRMGRGSRVSEKGFARLKVGGTTGMLLSMGDGLETAYVYLEAGPQEVKEARLHRRRGTTWETQTDTAYPFEFTWPLTGGGEVEFFVETVAIDGTTERSRPVTLSR